MCIHSSHVTQWVCCFTMAGIALLGLLSVLFMSTPPYAAITADINVASLSNPDPKDLGLSIPGTGVIGGTAVSNLRARLRCFSESGRWVYNATRRTLPWCVLGEYIWRECDERHRLERSGVFGATADDIALGRREGEWNVRESLKYEWHVDEPSCGWQRFERVGFCRAVGTGRNILLVGDSMSWQHHVTFLNHLNTDVHNPIFGPEKQRTFCSYHRRLCSDVLEGEGFSLIHKRNVYLTIGAWNLSEVDTYQQEWIDTVEQEDIRIIVLNRGAWAVDDDRYVRELNETLVELRKRHPDLLIIFRNTPPGHFGCASLPQKPLMRRQSTRGLPFRWGSFEHQNKLAKRLVEAVGGIYMDVDTMTGLRPDGHLRLEGRKEVDCLHYCLPGPLDVWMQLLYNIILQASEFAAHK